MFRRLLLVLMLSAVALAAAAVAIVTPVDASPRAARGVGIENVTTGSAAHPWVGSWRVQVGHGGPVVNAYCIRTGGWFPGSPSWPVADIAGPRGANATERAAMSTLLYRYGNTTDAVTAAAVNVALYSLSADRMAPGVRYPAPAQMAISHPQVRARAIALYDQAVRTRGPWKVQVAAAPRPGDPTRIRTSAHVSGPGGAIAGAAAFVTIGNGEGSGGYATDASGNITIDVTPRNPAAPVRIDVAFGAPATYVTLADHEVPQRQTVVHGAGTPLLGSASASLPAGRVSVVKTNTNPAWQDNAGARFELRSTSGNGRVARTIDGRDAVLVAAADGTTEKLAMAPGTYRMVETAAPDGQSIGFEARDVRVDAGADVVVQAENPADATAELVVSKTDADTGAPLTGARLLVERDHRNTFEWQPVDVGGSGAAADRSGRFEGPEGSEEGADGPHRPDGIVVSGDEPVVIGGLLAGRYRVTEIEAPPGYTLPEVREIVVEVGVGESVTVDFADVRPAITTKVSSHEALVGDELVDTVVVSNVATWNRAEVHVDLHGPFEVGETMTCDGDRLVASEVLDVVGPGTFESPPFVVDEPGVYTFTATWRSLEDGDTSEATHECGLDDETVIVRAPVDLDAIKYDATDRDHRLPGGVYRILVAEGDLPEHLLAFLRSGASGEQGDGVDEAGRSGGGTRPTGAAHPDDRLPNDRLPSDEVPDGYLVIGEDTTDADGEIHLQVFSHARYCFEEQSAPDGYVLDPELRCTAGLLTTSDAAPVELPEHPVPTDVEGAATPPSGPIAGTVPMFAAALDSLPKTGGSPLRLVAAAIAVSAAGGAFLVARRPRPHRI